MKIVKDWYYIIYEYIGTDGYVTNAISYCRNYRQYLKKVREILRTEPHIMVFRTYKATETSSIELDWHIHVCNGSLEAKPLSKSVIRESFRFRNEKEFSVDFCCFREYYATLRIHYLDIVDPVFPEKERRID